MNRVIATLLTAVLWSGAPLVAAAGEGCDTLGEHVAFVGAKGLSIDFAGVDAIAYWHVGDNDKVVVYERSDAEALVSDLGA